MEWEEDDRRTATPGLIPQTGYLALTSQLKLVEAVIGDRPRRGGSAVRQ